MLKVAIGADDAATGLKNLVKEHLQQKEIEVVDFSHDVVGNEQMYPDIAFNLASAIREGEFERGLYSAVPVSGWRLSPIKFPAFARRSVMTFTRPSAPVKAITRKL